MPGLRRNWEAGVWSEELEADYNTFLQSEVGEKFCAWLKDDCDEGSVEEETEVEWNSCENEAIIRSKCLEYFRAEVSTYDKLVQFQGHSIPKLLAVVSMRTQFSSHSKLQKQTVVYGVLLSLCDGFNLNLLAYNAPKEDWQSIGDQAVALVNTIGDHGILNEDVRPENCIVTKITQDSKTKYKLFLIDLAMSRVRGDDESDSDWYKAKCKQDEEGALGSIIDLQLRNNAGGAYNYTASDRWGFIGLDNMRRPKELWAAYEKYIQGKTDDNLCENMWISGEETVENRPQLAGKYKEYLESKENLYSTSLKDDGESKAELGERLADDIKGRVELELDLRGVGDCADCWGPDEACKSNTPCEVTLRSCP